MIDAEWKKHLMAQAVAHPSMEPQDVFKLIFQAAFGAEHLLENEASAYAYLEKEYAAVTAEEEPLYEQIQTGRYRVNLRAWKQRKLPLQWLFQMFVGSAVPEKLASASQTKAAKECFLQYIETANETAREGVFRFSYEALEEYAEKYSKQGLRAVHHSDAYRMAERPAYRLISGKYVRLLPILELIADCSASHANDIEKQGAVILAIDGRCASGKSTMADMLSGITGAGIVHMDDFYLPRELRTVERLTQPGGNVHYERFREEILPKLGKGRPFCYRRFDCSKMQPGECREVPNTSVCIVEGAYSCHPMFGKYADIKVFSHVEPEEQLQRIVARDGEKARNVFEKRWIPMEEQYFAAYHICETADIVV